MPWNGIFSYFVVSISMDMTDSRWLFLGHSERSEESRGGVVVILANANPGAGRVIPLFPLRESEPSMNEQASGELKKIFHWFSPDPVVRVPAIDASVIIFSLF
jgi:hypothetical protein